ncbi:MAG: hypothetical protein JNG86_22010, partial [Verrucomicrobiaceae bacterium]|nr:hypothetical protein [Verrucomicrobiaceae bacterium]
KDLRSGRQTGLGNPAPVDGGNPNGGFGFITTVSPTAFEMIPLGESMEIEVTEGDLGIGAHVSIHFTRLSGTVPYTSIHHPIVETRRLVVSIRAAENRRQLLGTLNKPFANGLSTSNKEDRVWFAFLRLTK